MTEIDEATAPFTEAEIKKHQAALMRQMVAVGVIICVMMILVGLYWSYKSVGLLIVAFDGSIALWAFR
jgi:hypothetical protein